MAYFDFPDLNPIAFTVGPLAVRWYGLAYVAGFVAAGALLDRLNRRWQVGLTRDQEIDLVLAAVIGVIVGGRLGYVLFYGGSEYLRHPLNIFATWNGGMSFHGGLVGILLAGWIMARRFGVPFLRLADMGAVGAPIGFLLGRLTNFVNGELWGRVTTLPWGVVFPGAGPLPRHPSQLYEAFLEGLVLFVILLTLSRKKRADGFMLGTLLLLYGVFRIAVEFAREPDVQLGFIAGPFTMGQLLSVPMLVAGAWLLWRTHRGKWEASEDGAALSAGPDVSLEGTSTSDTDG
ncbi:MAG: prolipoprotein diacylglyceryl transferase [Coriobacteriales bacterium]|nr:prolipoprotein diacylglyceryl transferase [Actinomycetes bacterium]